MQYTDFDVSISLPTLNTRLRKLLKFGLVEHCIAKQPKRREWYEITERGKNVLRIMEDMELAKNSKPALYHIKQNSVVTRVTKSKKNLNFTNHPLE